MFLLAYLVQITLGTTFVKYLYNIGYSNIFNVESGNGKEVDCKYFITFYTCYITYFPMLNVAVIFCRYVYVKYNGVTLGIKFKLSSSRFATGLVVEGRNLLYFLLLVCSFLFGLIWIIFWPVLGKRENIPLQILHYSHNIIDMFVKRILSRWLPWSVCHSVCHI